MTLTDPWRVLGVPRDASDERIREAYLEAIKQHPPERSAERFEELRDAYAKLSDARARLRLRLFDGQFDAPLVAMLGESERRHVGPLLWLDVIAQTPPDDRSTDD